MINEVLKKLNKLIEDEPKIGSLISVIFLFILIAILMLMSIIFNLNMVIIEEIKSIIGKLDEIDDYCDSLSEKISQEDLKEQDLLHLIENEKLTAFECYRVIKEMKKIREERRKIKHDMEIASSFNKSKNKLIAKEYRKFLIADLYKREKQIGIKYNNKYYTSEEIKKIIKRS